MKPHLPSTLRIALLACALTTVSASAATLDWRGNNVKINVSNAWYEEGTNTSANFTDGDNLILGDLVDTDGIDYGTTKQISTPKNGSSFAAGIVTVEADYTLGIDLNDTFSGTFEAAGKTLTKWWGGTLTLNENSNVSSLVCAAKAAQVIFCKKSVSGIKHALVID